MTTPTRPTNSDVRAIITRVARYDIEERDGAEDILALFTPWADALEQRLDVLREEVEGLAQLIVDADRPYSEVRAERTRQEMLRVAGKFLHTCASPDFVAFGHFGRAAVLGEEFGEVCRAVLDVEKIAEGRGDPGAARKKLRAELIQVAAVAVAYIEGLDGKELGGADHEVADLTRQRDNAVASCHEIDRQKVEWMRERDALNDRVRLLSIESDAQHDELIGLYAQMAALTRQLGEAREEIAATRRQYKEQLDRVARADAETTRVRYEADALRVHAAELTSQIERICSRLPPP